MSSNISFLLNFRVIRRQPFSSGLEDSSGGENLSGYKSDDIIAESAVAVVQREKRLVAGPASDWAVSYEMTAQRTVIKEAFSF